jgi:hypothetical protein
LAIPAIFYNTAKALQEFEECCRKHLQTGRHEVATACAITGPRTTGGCATVCVSGCCAVACKLPTPKPRHACPPNDPGTDETDDLPVIARDRPSSGRTLQVDLPLVEEQRETERYANHASGDNWNPAMLETETLSLD